MTKNTKLSLSTLKVSGNKVVCANLIIGLINMVIISNLCLNASKKENTIISNNFQHIMASTKHLILISKDDFHTNN